MQVELKC